MQTTTRRATRRTAPAVNRPLPYPDLERNEGRLFWLAAYFIDLSKAETVGKVANEMRRRQRDDIVTLSLSSGQSALLSEARRSLRHVLEQGLLPFAHPATTVFDGQGAA